MQFFGHFLFLLCASVLCITSTAGSHNSLLLNAKMHSKGQPQPHSIHKRQGDSDPLEQCTKVLIDEQCTIGYYQEVANLLIRCNESTAATETRDRFCRKNSMGEYCGLMDTFTLNNNIVSTCASSTSTCTPECRDSIISARNLLGCCVNAFNGTTEASSIPSLQYSLWSRCDVDLVTEECAPSAITITQSQIDPTCNFQNELIFIACRANYVESIQNRLKATEGCQDGQFDDIVVSPCEVNELGRYCVADLPDDEFETAGQSCASMTTCDSNCLEALKNLREAGGCCVNTFNNNSRDESNPEWLSYQFWSDCGAQTPGFCETRFSPALPTNAAIHEVPGIAAVFVFLLGTLV